VIQQGLQSGERVVVNGQLGVTPGGKVRVDQPAMAGKDARPTTQKASNAASGAES